MDKKKEIKIDPSFFSYSASSGGKKNTSRKKKEKNNNTKKELININNKDVKELLLQKLKQYRKNKLKPKQNLPSNHINKNITEDFLKKVKQKKNKTEQNILKDDFNKNIINLNSSNESNTIIQDEPNMIVNPYQNPIEIPISKDSLQNTIPKFSNLKNGSLPSYKEYAKTIPKKSHIQVEIENKDKEHHVELEIEKKYMCGKNKTKKKIGIFIKNNKLRRENEEKKINLKKKDYKTIKNYLKKNNLIKYGTSAPSNLIREIYENTKLCGNIKNINGELLVHNYINN